MVLWGLHFLPFFPLNHTIGKQLFLFLNIFTAYKFQLLIKMFEMNTGHVRKTTTLGQLYRLPIFKSFRDRLLQMLAMIYQFHRLYPLWINLVKSWNMNTLPHKYNTKNTSCHDLWHQWQNLKLRCTIFFPLMQILPK